MATGKRIVVVALMVLLPLAAMVSGAPAPAPAPAVIGGADDVDLGSMVADLTNVVVGDGYIGCLEMRFARCFADPTLGCVEDAMVECSLQSAAAPAAATTGPAAPQAGGPMAAGLLLGAVGGAIVHGIATAGVTYINCVETDLVRCYSDPTIKCVENAIGKC